jgi:hypothetical protein
MFLAEYFDHVLSYPIPHRMRMRQCARRFHSCSPWVCRSEASNEIIRADNLSNVHGNSNAEIVATTTLDDMWNPAQFGPLSVCHKRVSQAIRTMSDLAVFSAALLKLGVPTGIRTPVCAVRGRRPGPLDDGDPYAKAIRAARGAPHTGAPPCAQAFSGQTGRSRPRNSAARPGAWPRSPGTTTRSAKKVWQPHYFVKRDTCIGVAAGYIARLRHGTPGRRVGPRGPADLPSGRSSGVEHNLAKVGVEGSNPFARSNFLPSHLSSHHIPAASPRIPVA